MGEFKNNIDKIIADKHSGSTTMVNNTLDALIHYYRYADQVTESEIIENLNKLFKAHKNLVVLFQFINSFFNELQNNKSGNRLSFLIDYKNKWSDALAMACQHAINEIDFTGKSVLLHSNTSAVHLLFKQLAEKNIFPVVYQTASAPLNEGKIQAELLGNLGFKVNFIHENNVGNFIQHIDMAIFGADMITGQFFLNKSGTLPLTLVLDRFDKPAYVISDSRKIITGGSEFDFNQEDEKSPGELWENPPKNVKVINYYFERIPCDLINKFFTEKESLTSFRLKSKGNTKEISNLFIL